MESASNEADQFALTTALRQASATAATIQRRLSPWCSGLAGGAVLLPARNDYEYQDCLAVGIPLDQHPAA